MTHALKPSQYATLLAVVLTASFGDALLSRGMAQIGPVDLHHLPLLFHALANPNVIVGIVLLLGFFASYMTALSWADLTFVMPATAFGNVVIALLSHFLLHEHITLSRWIGILLLTSAVGFVANRPVRTNLTAEADDLDTLRHSPTTTPAKAAPTVAPGIAIASEIAVAPEIAELPVTRSGIGL